MRFGKIATVLGISGLLGVSLMCSAFSFPFFKKSPTTAPVVSQNYENVKNSVWCITFQLVWNDFMDKVANGKPIQLEGGNPALVDELNKKLYTANDISTSSYYKVQGEVSPALKKQIEKAIYKQFKEKSDIIGMVNWNAKNAYIFYAMLKKEFNFLTPFEILTSAPFNGSENVKYFGIKKNSDNKLRENVKVLFYNDNEYAIKLSTKESEDVILYKTAKNDDFITLYDFVMNNAKAENLGYSDTLKVPNIDINKMISYDELCNKKVLGTDKVITQAIQTIKFKLDNKGGSLKSEAIIGLMRTSLAPDNSRHFNFDEPFVLFLKEQGKDKPYFATRIENTEFLVKE